MRIGRPFGATGSWLCLLLSSLLLNSFGAGNQWPLQVAGEVFSAGSSSGLFTSDFLRDGLSGLTEAGLIDPLGLLPSGNKRVILGTTATGNFEVNGLPVLRIGSVLPEFWAQPASYSFFQKGPAAFSGFGRDAQTKDFAGVPFNQLRGYERDNGIPGRGATAPQPFRIESFEPGRAGLSLSMETVPVLRYEILFSSTVAGPFRIVQELTPDADGLLNVTLQTSGPAGYYKIQVIQP